MHAATKHKVTPGYVIFIILFTLLAFEFLLRLAKHNTTYTEQTGQKYASAYGQTMPTWFYTRPANSSFEVANSEFKYHYTTNSSGLRDREFGFKDTSAKHVICLGDSYTEGYGAPYDSTWPYLLQHYLNAALTKAEVLNAGAAGSDPFYEYMLYKYKLQSYRPNRLLICINATDLKDYIIRGGMERFKADGTTVCKKAPWFEPLYHYSYTMRFIINDVLGYTDGNLFVTEKEKRELSAKGMHETGAVLDSLNDLTVAGNCKLAVIIQQDILEYVSVDNDSRYEACLFEQLQTILEKKNIDVVNLHKALGTHFNAANYLQYSYPHDSHYNGKGYNILAHEILQQTDKKYPLFWGGY